MRYAKFAPVPALRSYVECYFVWEGGTNGLGILVDAPPTALTAFVFNFLDPYQVTRLDGSQNQVPQSFVSGQALKNFSIGISRQISQVGIVFRPTGIYKLFGVPGYELTDQRYPLADVFGQRWQEVSDRVREAKESQARIAVLEQELLLCLHAAHQRPDALDWAASEIFDRKGSLSIGEVMEKVFMSRRKFERQFLKQVGLSPKYYARIRRYGYACLLINGKRTVDWSQVLHKSGYYDQSHFIKDFREFSGRSPGQYLQDNREVSHHLDPG